MIILYINTIQWMTIWIRYFEHKESLKIKAESKRLMEIDLQSIDDIRVFVEMQTWDFGVFECWHGPTVAAFILCVILHVHATEMARAWDRPFLNLE